MKKILLLLVGVAIGLSSTAQLADGSFGPDFTVTDINGNHHTLYDILDSGYTVVMDLNATWCGPCWSYHTAGHLETLWEEHGPAGWPGVSANTTNDVFVFMIESDNSTTLDDLNGTTAGTSGDWVTGTHSPIVDDASVGDDYDITYYPTIFTVCPNRVVTLSGQSTSSQHYDIISECKSAVNGTNMSLFGYSGEESTCDPDINVKAVFQNMGTETVNSFSAEVLNGATTLASNDYNGTLAPYETAEIDFGNVTIDANSNLEIKITTSDDLSTDNSLTQSVNYAKGLNEMILKVTTDNYGGEVTWKIIDLDQNTTVAEGGPYANSSNTQTYDAVPQEDETVTLQADGCYAFEVKDSYGDGMYNNPASAEGPTFFKLVNSDGNTLLEIFGDEYTSSTSRKFSYKNTSSISENDISNQVAVYPNPTNGMSTLTIDAKENLSNAKLSVFNILGEKVISTETNLTIGTNSIPLNLTHLQSGIYTVELSSQSLNISQKLIKTE